MTVKVEINDRLATVTIDRPEVHDALSRHVLADQRRPHRSLTVSRAFVCSFIPCGQTRRALFRL